MPRTPTQRTHPASAVHPYTSPAQASYDHARISRPDARSPEHRIEQRTDQQGSVKSEQPSQVVSNPAESRLNGMQQPASSVSGGATPSLPGPSSAAAPSSSKLTSPNATSGTNLASSVGQASSTQPSASANGTKKKHVCSTCDRGFTTSGHLARHARVHTGERNHKCPFPGCETRCSRQDNLQQHYRIHLSPGSRRSASSAARAAAQNKAAAAAAAAMAISPIQTSPIGTLGPDDGPPPLAQAHPNLPPPPLSHAAPYPHGSLSTPYPPMALHTSPHLQHVNGGSSYSVPQTPPMGSYEVESQQNGALKNGHPVGNAGLAQTPPESPASHSTPSTGPSAHVPLPPSSYPSQYMGYANYAPTGPPPKISTFYQRHHYPPEAYTGASAAPQPSSSQQPLIPADQRYQQPQAMLHQSSDQLQVVEKERRRNRPSISSISSGQSPSQSPVITNGRLGPPTERMLPSHHESGHWQNGYSPYPPNGSTGPTPTAATNGDGNYNITASSAGSYAHSNSYMHHPPPSHPHYDVRSPPLPPPQSTGSTASTNSVTNSVLSETSHASSHTSYMSHVNVPSDQGHGHPNGVRSPPPVLAPIQTRGESANGQPMGGLEMGMGSIGGYHHPARHPFRPSALPYAVSADVGGYAGNAKAYNM